MFLWLVKLLATAEVAVKWLSSGSQVLAAARRTCDRRPTSAITFNQGKDPLPNLKTLTQSVFTGVIMKN